MDTFWKLLDVFFYLYIAWHFLGHIRQDWPKMKADWRAGTAAKRRVKELKRCAQETADESVRP